MDGRRSAWPAVISGLAGVGLLIAGMALPWTGGRAGSQLPMRSVFPWTLEVPEVQSILASAALPIVASAAFCVIAIGVRVRWLALILAVVTLGMEIAWFASEAFRRSRGDLLVTDLEVGAWLALAGALLLIVGASLTPKWEPVVR